MRICFLRLFQVSIHKKKTKLFKWLWERDMGGCMMLNGNEFAVLISCINFHSSNICIVHSKMYDVVWFTCCHNFKLRCFQILQRKGANKEHCDGCSWDNKRNNDCRIIIKSFTPYSTSSHRFDACHTRIIRGQVKGACNVSSVMSLHVIN